jgi:acyl carrier protein
MSGRKHPTVVMSLSELEATLLEWVRLRCEKDSSLSISLNRETDLIENGVLDSLAFVELMAFVESRTGISILTEPITIEYLTSIVTICGYVHHLMSTKPWPRKSGTVQ